MYYDTPVIVQESNVILACVYVCLRALSSSLSDKGAIMPKSKRQDLSAFSKGVSSLVPSTSILKHRLRSIHDSKYLGLPAGARRAGTWIIHDRQTVCKRPPGLLLFGSLTLGWPCTMLDACHAQACNVMLAHSVAHLVAATCPLLAHGLRRSVFFQGFSIAGSATPRDNMADGPGLTLHAAARTCLPFA